MLLEIISQLQILLHTHRSVHVLRVDVKCLLCSVECVCGDVTCITNLSATRVSPFCPDTQSPLHFCPLYQFPLHISHQILSHNLHIIKYTIKSKANSWKIHENVDHTSRSSPCASIQQATISGNQE